MYQFLSKDHCLAFESLFKIIREIFFILNFIRGTVIIYFNLGFLDCYRFNIK